MKKTPLLFLPLFAVQILFAQSNLTVHEWGTFTTVQNSNGVRIPGLAGEKLPPFVYDLKLDQCPTCNQGQAGKVAFKNIGVQMETPVLYFYTEKETPVVVDVQFKNGILNQWYPERSTGQKNPNLPVLDMAAQGSGYIQWKATIQKQGAALLPTAPNSQLTQEWVAPRNTAANFVKGPNGEIEHFLFYRGLANFSVPFKVEFNDKGNLVMHNQFAQNLPYVLVYDNSPERQPTLWWSGKLAAGEQKVIVPPQKDSDFMTMYDEIMRFRDELANAGLYKDEATAMLQTWYDGYFTDVTDVKGLRVFWIAPTAFVDDVLPLQITPKADKTARVFVGRSEVLTPDFEARLNELSLAKLESSFIDHRYLEVFKNGKNMGFPTQWTTYNVNPSASAHDNPRTQAVLMSVMPNPFSETMIVSSTLIEPGTLQFSLVDMSGKVIEQWQESGLMPGVFKKSYSLKHLEPGFYVLQLQHGQQHWSTKIIKR